VGDAVARGCRLARLAVYCFRLSQWIAVSPDSPTERLFLAELSR